MTFTDLSPMAIAHDLRDNAARLDTLSRRLREAHRAYENAEADYRRKRAQAVLRSQGRSDAIRQAEADADDTVFEAMLARNVARADVEAAKVDSANLRALVSTGQSLLRLAEAEVSAYTGPRAVGA